MLREKYLNLWVGWTVEIHNLDFRRAHCVCLRLMVVDLWGLSSPPVENWLPAISRSVPSLCLFTIPNQQ